LKHVGGAKNLQDDLAIFLTTLDRSPEPRVLSESLHFGDDLGRDLRRQRWIRLV